MDQRKVTTTCENRTHDRRNKQRSEMNKNQFRRIIKKKVQIQSQFTQARYEAYKAEITMLQRTWRYNHDIAVVRET